MFVVSLTLQKRLALISSQDHYQRSTIWQISDTRQAVFDPAQNLNSIATFFLNLYVALELRNWSRSPTNDFRIQNRWFVTVKFKRTAIKVNLLRMVDESILMEKVHGILVVTLLEILCFLVLIMVYHSSW